VQAVKQYGSDRHENAGYLNEEFMGRPADRQLDAVLPGGDQLDLLFGYSPSASGSSGGNRGVTTPLARAEGRVVIERLFDRMSEIRVAEAAHGPVGARRYEYLPTYMIRGLRQFNLEFD
jgi:hypothetical protein